MARLFPSHPTYLYRTEAVCAAMPRALSIWFNLANTDAASLMALVDSGAYNDVVHCFGYGSNLYASEAHGGGSGSAITTTTYSTGVWNHGLFVFVSATSRMVWLNGAGLGTNATSKTAANLVATNLACQAPGGWAQIPNGSLLADAAIWDLTGLDLTAWTDGTIAAALAGGKSAYWYPTGLTAWWPLGNPYATDDDLDHKGSHDLTPYGGTALFGTGPTLTYPTNRCRRVLLGACA